MPALFAKYRPGRTRGGGKKQYGFNFAGLLMSAPAVGGTGSDLGF
jgi:hypothetical protein